MAEKDLSWIEPSDIFAERNPLPPFSWAKQGGIALVTALASVGIRFMSSRVNPANPVHWPSFVGIAAVIGLFVGFGWPLLARRARVSHIILSPKGINNNVQVGTRVEVEFVPWTTIAHVDIRPYGDHSIAIVRSHAKQVLMRVGIPSSTEISRVRGLIQSMGVELTSGPAEPMR